MGFLIGLVALWLCLGLFYTLLVLMVFLCEKRPTEWSLILLPLFGPLVFVGLVAMILKSNVGTNRSKVAAYF